MAFVCLFLVIAIENVFKTYAVVGIAAVTIRAGASVVARRVLAESVESARSRVLALVDI